jgi:hypothetical protein
MTVTLRPFDTAPGFRLDRVIAGEWRAGESVAKPGEMHPTETVLRFEVRHRKDTKAFVADLTPHEYGELFVKWSSESPGIRILAEPVARYSDKSLHAFFERAYEHLVSVADDPRVSHYLAQIPGVVVSIEPDEDGRRNCSACGYNISDYAASETLCGACINAGLLETQ